MKTLIINEFNKINDKKYIGFITFGEYLSLLENDFIEFEKDTRAEIMTYDLATEYNDNEDINNINGIIINLHIENNDKNSINENENKLYINFDKLTLIDGVVRSEVIRNLDNRFMNSILMVNIDYCTHNEMKNLLC